jgi:hypothetical protein
MKSLPGLALSALLAITAACDSTSPGDRVGVGISFSSKAAAAGPRASMAITMTSGANTLVITKAQLVLRELELKLAESSSCATGTGADDCEEIELGPMLIDLPVTDAIATPITAQVPPGTYREIEFDIRRPGTDPTDAAFVAANPNFNNVSIRVEGTYNGTPFVFTSQLDQEVQIDLSPPAVITDANSNVTIAVNIRDWFTGTGGTLISPATANPGQPNASIVAEKIKLSLRAFEDDDKNGQ